MPPSKRAIISAALADVESCETEQRLRGRNTSGLKQDVSRLVQNLARAIVEEQNGTSDT